MGALSETLRCAILRPRRLTALSQREEQLWGNICGTQLTYGYHNYAQDAEFSRRSVTLVGDGRPLEKATDLAFGCEQGLVESIWVAAAAATDTATWN
jgi:hypothetical protein